MTEYSSLVVNPGPGRYKDKAALTAALEGHLGRAVILVPENYADGAWSGWYRVDLGEGADSAALKAAGIALETLLSTMSVMLRTADGRLEAPTPPREKFRTGFISKPFPTL